MIPTPLRALVCACATLALLVLVGCNGARNTAVKMLDANKDGTGFVSRTVKSGDSDRKYALFVPRNIPKGTKLPMIVFLHGIGESGSDLSKPLSVGMAPFVADQAHSFDFFVLFPQSRGGWDEDSQDAVDVINAINDVKAAYPVDPDRISLTGLSTGGYGTFAIGAKYKDVWAALVPMCPSGGAAKHGQTLATMTIWAIENSADPFVAPGSMASTLGAIKKHGGNPRHTVYPAFGHNCWETAYGEGELFAWLRGQRRVTAAAPTPIKSPATPTNTTATPAKPATGASSSNLPNTAW